MPLPIPLANYKIVIDSTVRLLTGHQNIENTVDLLFIYG
jgi:hypothetical protein